MIKKIEIRPNGTRRVYTELSGTSMADQSQKAQCDVNNIMARYKKTGQITHLARNQGLYADISTIKDLQTSLAEVSAASEAFNTLPAETRYRFQNNPVELINFLQDPNNYEEAVQLGLMNPKPQTTEPTKTEPTKTKTKQPKINDDDLNDDDKTPKS